MRSCSSSPPALRRHQRLLFVPDRGNLVPLQRMESSVEILQLDVETAALPREAAHRVPIAQV